MPKKPKRMKIRYEYVKTPQSERNLEQFFDSIFEDVYRNLFNEYTQQKRLKITKA
jgi:hypothetical protein